MLFHSMSRGCKAGQRMMLDDEKGWQVKRDSNRVLMVELGKSLADERMSAQTSLGAGC